MKSACGICCVLFALLLSASAVEPPADKREVSARKQERVVSMAPNLTEIIYAIGAQDRLVGRTSVCNYPPDAVKTVPVVGGFGEPSLELLLKVKATLVLEVDFSDKALKQKISELGIRVEHVPCQTLADIPAAIRTAGKLLERSEKANSVADELEREIAAARKSAGGEDGKGRPLVFAEIWNDPLTTVGKNSFISELIRLAGGVNIGDRVDTAYYTASPELVVSRNPDIILCLHSDKASAKRERFLERPGWSRVRAVQSGRIYADFDLDLMMRPGPRVMLAVGELRKRIAADTSGQARPEQTAGKE